MYKNRYKNSIKKSAESRSMPDSMSEDLSRKARTFQYKKVYQPFANAEKAYEKKSQSFLIKPLSKIEKRNNLYMMKIIYHYSK